MFRNLFFVNTGLYVFQMPVLLTLRNTGIWQEAYNQAVAPGITRRCTLLAYLLNRKCVIITNVTQRGKY